MDYFQKYFYLGYMEVTIFAYSPTTDELKELGIETEPGLYNVRRSDQEKYLDKVTDLELSQKFSSADGRYWAKTFLRNCLGRYDLGHGYKEVYFAVEEILAEQFGVPSPEITELHSFATEEEPISEAEIENNQRIIAEFPAFIERMAKRVGEC